MSAETEVGKRYLTTKATIDAWLLEARKEAQLMESKGALRPHLPLCITNDWRDFRSALACHGSLTHSRLPGRACRSILCMPSEGSCRRALLSLQCQP